MTTKRKGPFDAQAFLDSAGVERRIVEFRRAEPIYSQGDSCDAVLYIQAGNVKLSVLSTTGREAVVALLGPGEFFGEGCLAGQCGWAVRRYRTTILFVDKRRWSACCTSSTLSDRFIAHAGARIRIEGAGRSAVQLE